MITVKEGFADAWERQLCSDGTMITINPQSA